MKKLKNKLANICARLFGGTLSDYLELVQSMDAMELQYQTDIDELIETNDELEHRLAVLEEKCKDYEALLEEVKDGLAKLCVNRFGR